MEIDDDTEGSSVASFSLPASPTRSPVSSEAMPAWVEDSDCDHRVHLSLEDAPCVSIPSDAPAFPLVPWECTTSSCRDHHSDIRTHSSSALVPFQKLEVDTNLNETTLPYRTSPRSRTSSIGSPAGSCSGWESPGRKKPKTATQQLASGFLGVETERTSTMSQDFVNALRLGDLTQEAEPQLSVRLRGTRIELASASEEEQVDFLGPAENIKRLFKLPYSQSRVSLAVHRVGTTLVVDGELDENDLPAEFEDVPQDTLQLVQQTDETTQRLLYEKFIYESTMTSSLPASEKEEQVLKKKKENGECAHGASKGKKKQAKKTRRAKKSKQKVGAVAQTMAEKDTMSHEQLSRETASIVAIEKGDENEEHVRVSVSPSSVAGSHFSWSTKRQAPSCPSYIPAETNWFTSAARHSPTYGDSQTFQRVLKWKFNDLKMILGSQVLLFSNKEHPAVSLKLHDMDKDLSLCTVLDYYLDNVIANIPELAICMHSKGFVRGYKLVETRQIPYMSATGRPLFDVQDVSMNASMLLKFLQENCLRQNGTYWLHRKEGETSLRLYDVDVLSRGSQLKWKYMMAMLCYRFAARASRLSTLVASGTPQLQKQLQQRQRDLLRTCMSLLGEIAQKGGAAHSSICSSVSEQLADTYLRECHQLHSFNSATTSSADSDRDAAIQSLEKAKQYLLASIKLFKECIPSDSSSALTCSDDDATNIAPMDADEDGEMGSFMDEELNRLQLKFSSACLELGHLYASNHMWIEALKCVVESSQFLSASSFPDDVRPLDLSSQDNLVELLLDKMDFDGVGRDRLSQDTILICVSGAELRCCLLGLLGDVAAQKPASVYDELAVLYDILSGIKAELLSSLCENASDFLKACTKHAEVTESKIYANREEDLLSLSFLAYLRGLLPPVNSELYFMMMKKLGNASNELGKFFLAAKCDYKKAFKWFERGCKIFSDIEDGVNVALLRANLAHLHKIFAQGKSADLREEHYRLAVELCNDALQLLKQSKADVGLHYKVKGELALTYLVWAVDSANDTSIIDTTGRSLTKARENEVLKIFNKALSLYTELGDQKQIASTQYQIASFYSRMISRAMLSHRDSVKAEKTDETSSTLTNRMEIARRYYEKALKYFGTVEVGKTFVLIHRELADLHLLGGHFESIEHALLILLGTYEAFTVVSTNDLKVGKAEMALLARDIVAKIKAVLYRLIRLCSTAGAHAKGKKLESFKKMYKEVIYSDGNSAERVIPILGTLREMYSN